MQRSVITIDGLAGSGKSTLARLLAERIGFIHLNSGLLYRSVAYLARRLNILDQDGERLRKAVVAHKIFLNCDGTGTARLYCEGKDITDDLQSREISALTSELAVLPAVREVLLPRQREAFPGRNLVAEGRDMGTVVFPDAQVHFFIQASVDVRTERRIRQLGFVLDNALKLKMKLDIDERDRRDSERKLAPTVAAKDAILVDNSLQELTAVVEEMYQASLSRGIKPERV